MSGPRRTEIAYDYDGCPTLADFAKSDAFMRGIVGPFGSGKSSASVIEVARRGRNQAPLVDGKRRTRFAVIRNTFPQLQDTTMKTFFDWMPPKHFGDYVAGEHTYYIRRWGNIGIEIEVMFRALDTPESVRKLLSLDLTGAWVNEAREIPWQIIEAVQGRVGRYPSQRDGGPTWHGVWMDTNPPDVESEWYKFFEETEHPPGFARVFRQPSGLSPEAENLSNLPGGRKYYSNLAVGKAKNWVDVYIHGRYGFVQSGKAVFPEFIDQIHTKEIEPIPGLPVYRGFDFGLTPACSFSQVLPDGRWLVFDELYSESSGIEAFADAVVRYSSSVFEKQPKFIDIGDPAGMQRAQTDERTCFGIMHAMGIEIEPGIQTMAMRLEAIRKPLTTMVGGMPQFVLHPRCKVLRKAFLGLYRYRRMRVTGERYTDQPEKNQVSHIMDSLQYQATRIFASNLLMSREQQLAARTEGEFRREIGGYAEQFETDNETRNEITGY